MMPTEIPRYWPRIADPKAAVALLKREGFWHLSGYDGCLCGRVSIFNFQIEVHCRKSSESSKTEIVVGCRSLGSSKADLQMVADEVARQASEAESTPVMIILKGGER